MARRAMSMGRICSAGRRLDSKMKRIRETFWMGLGTRRKPQLLTRLRRTRRSLVTKPKLLRQKKLMIHLGRVKQRLVRLQSARTLMRKQKTRSSLRRTLDQSLRAPRA
jgi:hypothetical protein